MALATAFASCPNKTFLKKHFCHWCKDEKDALKFATDSNSHRTNPTQINDVIMSSNKNSGQVGFHMNDKYCEHTTKTLGNFEKYHIAAKFYPPFLLA